jgi:hypothetical protein
MSEIYQPFKGLMFKTKELGHFTSAHWIYFLNFSSLLIGTDSKGDEAFTVTKEKIAQIEEYMKIPQHPYQEFLYRIDRFSDSYTPRDFYVRFQTMVRMLLTYLKRNPSSVSPEMKEIMEQYPERLGWALKQYEVVTLENGDEVVERNVDTPDGPIKVTSIQEKMQNSLLQIADIMETLSSSFTKTELKSLDVKEKIAALSKLSYIFDVAKKGKVGSVTQINFNAPTKDLEKQMLDMVKKRE